MEKYFKSYDVRYTFPELSPVVVSKIGAGYSNWCKGKKIVIGYDGRSSSKLLADSFSSGARASGSDVILIGLVPTPVLAYTAKKFDSYGAMISASHNPPEYNGIKFVYPDGSDLKKKELMEVRDLSKIPKYSKWNELGKDLTKQTLKDFKTSDEDSICDVVVRDYANYISEKLEKPLKVVIDSKNGAGCGILAGILSKLGCSAFEINGSIDPSLPNGGEPTEESSTKLKEKMKEGEFDLGVALDADADRVTFVDDTGRFIRSDYILMLFSKFYKPKSIVATLNCTTRLEEFAKVNWCKVGRGYVTDVVQETESEIAGEYSGHFWFTDKFDFSDGIMSAIKFVKLLSHSNKKFSELVNALPQTFVVHSKAEVADEKKPKVLETLKKENPDANTLDGLKIPLEGGWVLIRKSNTEPVIRVSTEKPSEAEAEAEAEKWVEKIKKLV